jgi:hypothetical protein
VNCGLRSSSGRQVRSASRALQESTVTNTAERGTALMSEAARILQVAKQLWQASAQRLTTPAAAQSTNASRLRRGHGGRGGAGPGSAGPPRG